MDETELEQCRALLGVAPAVTVEELERVFMKRNFALIKGKSGAADEPNPELDAQRQALRAAYEKLSAHLRDQARQTEAAAATARKKPQLTVPPMAAKAPLTRPPMTPLTAPPMPAPRTLITPPEVKPRDPADDEFILLRFDHWGVNVLVPPLLLAGVWLVNLSPLGFFLKGFHVWMHEFGHAVPAWLSGWRATPLPFGWTPVEQVHSNFVYFGLLSLLVALLVAGAVERKVWPMLAAVAIAGLQYYMTWRLPEARKEFWMVFGGVGGEFALSTLLMMAFWVQLPEKFRWGACRYVFFLIGATAFLNIWMRWGDIHRGLEEIPFGSMINGEEDAGGDMNRLMDDYGWKKADIRRNYWLLGRWCWVALGVMWLIFALRLNRVADWVTAKFSKAE
ncbi:MAG TPA: hypothetical protein VGD97_02740 [Lacunisphaera sp.]